MVLIQSFPIEDRSCGRAAASFSGQEFVGVTGTGGVPRQRKWDRCYQGLGSGLLAN